MNSNTVPNDIAVHLRKWAQYFNTIIERDQRSRQQLFKICPAAEQLTRIAAYVLPPTTSLGQSSSTHGTTSTSNGQPRFTITVPGRRSTVTFAAPSNPSNVPANSTAPPAASSQSSKHAPVQSSQSIHTPANPQRSRTSKKKQRVLTTEALPSESESVQQPVQNFGNYPVIHFKSAALRKLPVVDPATLGLTLPQKFAWADTVNHGNFQEAAMYLYPVSLQ